MNKTEKSLIDIKLIKLISLLSLQFRSLPIQKRFVNLRILNINQFLLKSCLIEN